MGKHQIKIENFADFEHESIIASSSEGKRLVICSSINASGELISYFSIRKRYPINHKYIEQSRQLLLNMAVDDYNNL